MATRVGIGATPTCVSLGLAPVVSPFASPTVLVASAVCCLSLSLCADQTIHPPPFATLALSLLRFSLSFPRSFRCNYPSSRLHSSFLSPFFASLPLLFRHRGPSYPLSSVLSLCQLHSITGFKLESAQFPRQRRRICKTATRDDLTAFRLRPQS